MRIAAVGDAPWNDLVDAVAAHHEHVHVEHLAPKLAIPLAAFNASRFDVALVAPAWAEAIVEIAAAPATARVAAHGLLAEHGPSIFVPAPDGGFALAGSGVVNPSSMLLAAAMMLEYGLDAPVAGATLAGAVSAVLVDGPRTPDLLHGGVGATSREFTSRVDVRLPALAAVGGCRMKMNGADAILRSLEAEGVDVMFGLPGGAILPLYDAMARGTTVRHVLARHEQGAGHMAEGYARASGRVGVAIATSGPGATNLVTPIADAWMDSTPLVCITGQVRSFLIGTDAFQECDITGITIPIVKHSWLVQDVNELPHVLKAAFHVARTGRCGPVLVDVPRDVQEAELDFSYPDTVSLPGLEAAAPRPCPPDRCCRDGGRRRGAADPLRRRRSPERARHRRAPGARRVRATAGRHDADGEERVPRVARAARRLARHARAEVVELGAEQGGPDRRGRRALRRPRDRQGLGVRAGRDRRPSRHRRGGDLEDPARRHPRRRAAEARARAAPEGAGREKGRVENGAVAPADRPLARGVPAPLPRRAATC